MIIWDDKLAWTKSRKSYCTNPGVAVGVDVDGSISKMLKFLR